MHLEEAIKKVDRSLNITKNNIQSTLIEFGYFQLGKQVRMKDETRPKLLAKDKNLAEFLTKEKDSKIAYSYMKPTYDSSKYTYKYVRGSAIEENENNNEDLPF